MFEKIGAALKGVIYKPDGSFNWKGALLTGGLALGGAVLMPQPQMALAGILLGAGTGVAVNHFLFTPKTENPAAGPAPDAQVRAGAPSTDAMASLAREAGGHILKHGLPDSAAKAAVTKATQMLPPF